MTDYPSTPRYEEQLSSTDDDLSNSRDFERLKLNDRVIPIIHANNCIFQTRIIAPQGKRKVVISFDGLLNDIGVYRPIIIPTNNKASYTILTRDESYDLNSKTFHSTSSFEMVSSEETVLYMYFEYTIDGYRPFIQINELRIECSPV